MIALPLKSHKDYAEKIYTTASKIKNIKIIDFVDFHKIDEYFKKARVFVNSSIEEGFPNTFIQACKNKTPIVSLDVNPDNFIDNHEVGVFCNGILDV